MDKDTIISQLENENILLKKQNEDLEERLKKYTDNTKKYYENHKEEIKKLRIIIIKLITMKIVQGCKFILINGLTQTIKLILVQLIFEIQDLYP